MPSVQCLYTENIHWQQTPKLPLNDDLHLWFLRTDDYSHRLEELQKILSQWELEKANGFKFEADRQRNIVYKAVQRIILSRYTNTAPDKLQFAVTANNKPLLQHADSKLHFNISHSGIAFVIAIANSEVGIDIEQIDPVFDFSDVVNTCFSKDEAAKIRKHGHELFYKYWTRKEALAKALGNGIDENLKYIPCTGGIHSAHELVLHTDWTINTFIPLPGYVCSAAYSSSIINTSLIVEKTSDSGLQFIKSNVLLT